MCSLFRFLFVAGVEFEPDGGTDEAEGGADLVGEEALEGEVETDVAVGEEDEGGRGRRRPRMSSMLRRLFAVMY